MDGWVDGWVAGCMDEWLIWYYYDNRMHNRLTIKENVFSEVSCLVMLALSLNVTEIGLPGVPSSEDFSVTQENLKIKRLACDRLYIYGCNVSRHLLTVWQE